MNTDQSLMAELCAAFAKAQSEFTTVAKNATNTITATRKAKYADMTAIWEMVRPVLARNNLFMIQTFKPSTEGVTVCSQVFHTNGASLPVSEMYIPVAKTQTVWDRDSQQHVERPVNLAQHFGIGATYGRRYNLSAYLGIVTDEDDDGAGLNQEYQGKPKQQQPVKQERSVEQRKAEWSGTFRKEPERLALMEACLDLTQDEFRVKHLKAEWKRVKADMPMPTLESASYEALTFIKDTMIGAPVQ